MSYKTALIDGCGFSKAAYDPESRQLAHRFLQRVWRVLLDNRGVRLVVAWDPEDNVSGRRARFPDYKRVKGRKERAPDPFEVFDGEEERRGAFDDKYLGELRELTGFLQLAGVEQAWSDGWEADDVLATLARTSERPAVVLTRDRDLLQLVETDLHVLMKIGKKEVFFTPRNVEKDRGLPPFRYTDWKTLAGDAGDGVPGVPGLGKGAADEIMEKYPTAVTEILAGGLDPWRLKNFGLSTRTKNLLLRAAEDPDYLRVMRFLVELHNVPVTVKRGRRDLKRLKRALLQAGLVEMSSRVRELEGR